MRRIFFLVLMFLFALFILSGQNSAPIDLILVLDISSSMSLSYNNINDYITGSFLKEYLRMGDTFHLITYNTAAKLDIARRITERGDVETIIGRMLIQYPIEISSNVNDAVKYVENYISFLPSRPKKVVMLGASDSSFVSSVSQKFRQLNTTFDYIKVTPALSLTNLPSSGRQSPPPAAQAGSSAAQTGSTAAQTGSTTPVSSAAQAGSTTAQTGSTTSVSSAAQAGSTTAQTGSTTSGSSAAQAGSTTSGSSTTQAGSTVNTSQTENSANDQTISGNAAITDSLINAGNQSETAGQTIPNDIASNGAAVQNNISSNNETDTSESDSSKIDVTQTDKKAAGKTSSSDYDNNKNAKPKISQSSLWWIIGIIIAALLILGLIIFITSRRLGGRANRVINDASISNNEKAAAPFSDHSKDLANYAANVNKQRSTPYKDRPVKTDNSKNLQINPTGPLLLNLFVEDQNTAIGKRNIHSLKSGYKFTIGGGKNDDYYIFLVPIPSNIGEIRRNGSKCDFVPKKTKYFPDLGSNELKDCINKTIRIISDKNYEIRFRFDMYEDPLDALNRLLTSLKVPG